MFRASKQYTCEHCGTVQGTWRLSKAGNVYRSITVAAHRYPNDTHNPHPDLLCLCERCHPHYDGLFRGMIEEGMHQALMHEILVERFLEEQEEGVHWDLWSEDEDEGGCRELPVLDGSCVPVGVEPVCCSCGVQDVSLAFGCGCCGRLVHYHEPECGGWLLDSWHDEAENEFWCLQCLENGLP